MESGIVVPEFIDARVGPRGSLDNLSQAEIDKLLDSAQRGPLSLLRQAAHAVLKAAPVSREQDEQGCVDNTGNVKVATAAAFGTLVARDKHDLVQRIKAGRIWQRMHLWATTQGLAVQPLNQVVERAEREVS